MSLDSGIGADHEFVVWYKFGGYVYPPAETVEAYKKIEAAYIALEAERRLIGEWHGNLVLYRMNSKQVNPDITPEQIAECVEDAKKRFPHSNYRTSWVSSNQGVVGVSVRMREILKELPR